MRSNMKIRGWFGLMVMVVISVLGGKTAAQDDSPPAAWSLWFHDSAAAGTFQRLWSDGRLDDPLQLPLPDGYTQLLFGDEAAFSADQSLLAVCATNDKNAMSIVLYDMVARQIVWSFDAGQGVACTLNAHSFSPDHSQLAVGVLADYEAQDQPMLWRFYVLDRASAAILNQLDSTMPALAPSAIGYLSVPETVTWTNTGLIFRLKPFHVGEWGLVRAAVDWDMTTDTLTPAPLYGQPSYHVLPASGEAIWLGYDERWPAAAPEGITPPWNAVFYQNQAAVYPIATIPNGAIVGVQWIADGQAIVVYGLSNDTTRNVPVNTASIVWRDGSTMPLADVLIGWGETGMIFGRVLMGTPTGFLHQGIFPNGSQEIEQHTLDKITNALMAKRVYFNYAHWQVIWVTPLEGQGDLTAFRPLMP